MILLGPEVRDSGIGAAGGLLAALCVPFTFGVYYSFVSRRWPSGLDSVQIAAGEVLATLPIMLPLYLWSGATAPFLGTWGTG